MPDISVFGNIYETETLDNVDLLAYLMEVRDGRWEDIINKIRTKKDEKERDRLKSKLLNRVTFSGLFSVRRDEGLLEHSGILAIDLDDLSDPESTKNILSQDRFVFSCFLSSGGHGLTVLFKIKANKHRESFLAIAEYLDRNYSLIPDNGSISVSKPFGVTFDPNIYIATHNVPVWTSYLPERKPIDIPNFAFAKDDFEKIINEIVTRKIDLTERYDEWLKIGFAFANQFGENGRDYFHAVSSVSPKYNKAKCDKQYKYCLRNKSLNVATIKSFYWYCKDRGLQITSERTAKIRKAVLNSKAAGLSKKQISDNLKKYEKIVGADDLISQIFDGTNSIGDGESEIEQIEIFLNENYDLERNVITRFIEWNNKPLEQRDLNSIFISAKKNMPNIRYDIMERLIMSDFVKNYNPFHRYFENLDTVKVKDELGNFISPNIDKFAACIKNDIPEWTEYFVRKWVVGIISAAFGVHSPLMLVLSGERHGRGKTEYFRRMLPQELKKYYAETKLDREKDDEILMTQKLILMDDEYSGKSKKDYNKIKDLSSKQIFTLREPYGKYNVDLMRLAVLCATSNSRSIIHDPSDNRRIIPVPVDDIDKELYNTIDKTELFAEAYSLWKEGFDWQIITEDDKSYLNKYQSDFEAPIMEKELILKYYSYSKPDETLSTSEIKVDLERLTNQRLSLDMLGKQLSKIGYLKKSVRRDGQSSKLWLLRKVNRSGFLNTQKDDEENPF